MPDLPKLRLDQWWLLMKDKKLTTRQRLKIIREKLRRYASIELREKPLSPWQRTRCRNLMRERHNLLQRLKPPCL